MPSLQSYFQEIIQEQQDNKFPFWNFKDIDIPTILSISDEIKSRFKNLLIVGTGASVTNARALLSIQPKRKFDIKFLDNIDITSIKNTLAVLDAKETAILIISKSGDTNETLALLNFLCNKGFVSNNLYIITENKNSELKKLGIQHSTAFIDHATDIGGRFAILTAVGLLPAAIADIDIKKIIDLAKRSTENISMFKDRTINKVQWVLDNITENRNCFVMMYYGEQLAGLYEWIRQMCAESLGKSGFGFTPIVSRGTIDQHSQLQLYLDGPDDKFFQIMYLNQGYNISQQEHDNHLNQLFHLHAKSTYLALQECKRPVQFETIDELYQYITNSIIETMLNIILIGKLKQINPFDQPAVEIGKKYITDMD
jgi:glucose-6-phosphate isomerase